MAIVIEATIKTIAYVLIFLGISWLVYPLIIDFYRLQKRSYRIKKQSNSLLSEEINKRKNRLHEHIKLVVESLAKSSDDKVVLNFYLLTLVMFVATFMVLFIILKLIVFPLLIAFVVSAMPYVWKRFKLAAKRLEISYAFMKEFHIFLQAYQHNKDIYHTMVETVKNVQDKGLKLAFMRVLSNMQKERTLSAFQDSMKLFMFTINTSFGTRFANLLTKEYRDNVDISEALLDLHVDLRKREKDMSTLKTKRMETIILGYMPLAILPIFLVLGKKMSVMYSTSFILAQKESLIFFMIALVVAIISAMSAYLLNKPNADV